jgi:uncharacterized protein (TIGR02391 family)
MLKELLEKIQNINKEFKQTYGTDLDYMAEISGKVIQACNKLADSWSGSYAGYHGRLYYKDFQIPPLSNRFSVEWGGIHGIPDGWTDRSAEEVKRKIENLVQENFSVDELENLVKKLITASEQLRTEIVINLSSFTFNGSMQKEKELFAKIEQFKFGLGKDEFVKANLPRSMVTRDSEALLQGMCVPAHLYYEGIGNEAESTFNSVEKFVKLSERLVRQLRLKIAENQKAVKHETFDLVNLHPEIYTKCHELYVKGAYAEAVEKSFKVVRDRLRKLTGHETGSEAFGKGRLHIKGAVAPNVDKDFNEGVKFLTMAIDRFRNEKSHTSDAKIDDPTRAYEYLSLSSLAMNLLEDVEILTKE